MSKDILLLWIILFLSVNSVRSQTKNPDSIDVYLVKESWHTGIMFEINDYTIEALPVLSLIKDYLYIDIGWGDADFYQTPGMDLYLAAKAVLVPTPTVIRIDGYKFPIEKIIEWREFAIKFRFSQEEFSKLTKFINDHIVYDENMNPVITKHEPETPIYFIKSRGEYHLFRTCNTWAAQVINATGIGVDTFGLVTASQLYAKFARYGKVIKRFK